eukprot:TRINITY_DN3137_c0_g1_i1.p1 TRINITY_DN3137_c0_g1~~TRINITY_DN3137_c0_g1_i1.p1  ORF type:complete len:689 (+),score=117.93 TRINITY_DN3137_c0_g1_i1:58-2124(+)
MQFYSNVGGSSGRMVRDSERSKEELIEELVELREVNARLEIALDLINQSVSICEIDGTTTFMNRTSETILGIETKDKLLGSNFYQTFEAVSTLRRLREKTTRESFTNRNFPGLAITSHKQFSTINRPFLVNVISVANEAIKTEKTTHPNRQLMDDLPTSVAIWAFQEGPYRDFKLIYLNKQIQTQIPNIALCLGRNISQMIGEPNIRTAIRFFSDVLITSNTLSMDDFSLDGNQFFSVMASPLPDNCVLTTFQEKESSKKTCTCHFYQAFLHHPEPISFVKKKKDQNGLIEDLIFFTSNIASGNIRSANYNGMTPVSLKRLEALFKMALEDPDFLHQLNTKAIGDPVLAVFDFHINSSYKPGTYILKWTSVTNDLLMATALPINREKFKFIENVFQRSIQTNTSEVKDYFYYTDVTDSIRFGGKLPQQMNQLPQVRMSDVPLEMFQKYFYQVPIAQAIISTTGQFLVSNLAMKEMLGYSTNDIEKATFIPFTHPDDVEKSVEAMRKALAGEGDMIRFTKRYIHKEGHTVTAFLYGRLQRDAYNRPTYFFTTFHPLENLRSALDSLDFKKEEEIFRQLFLSAPFGLVACHPNGNVLNVNGNYCSNMNLRTPIELLAKPIFSCYKREDRDNLQRAFFWIVENPNCHVQILAREETTSIQRWLTIWGIICDQKLSYVIIRSEDTTFLDGRR